MHSNDLLPMITEHKSEIDDLALNNDGLTDQLLGLVTGGLPRNKRGDDRSKGCTEAGGGIWDPYLFPVDF